MRKRRVMYVLWHYPQISETYMQTEMEALQGEYDICVISRNAGGGNLTKAKHHFPFTVIQNEIDVVRAIDLYKPDVIHSHWLIHSPSILRIARRCTIPFTIRAHSFDTIPSPDPRMRRWMQNCRRILTEVACDDLCLGIVAFPFSRTFLLKSGVPDRKIHDCYPVVNYDRFFDRSENGEDVMNTGACIPKKRMEDFLELGKLASGKHFRLYPVSYDVDDINRLNERMGAPVDIMSPVEPCAMPAQYKRHRWLVYTACPMLQNVGWPLAVAEAQASGVGVVVANIRPDMKQYIGDAGYLYNDLTEAARIICGPLPDEIRELGFEQAKRSDINLHKSTLTNLWLQ